MSNFVHSKWQTFDKLVVGYCIGMALLVAVLGRPLSNYVDEIFFYVGCAVLAHVIVQYFDESRGGIVRVIRMVYPVALFSFFYRATGGTMDLLFDSFFDAQLTAFEMSVFGWNPTVFIDQHLLHPALSEYFLLSYLLYYPLIPLFLYLVYRRGDFEIVRSSVTAFCGIFFASYALFFLYPIEGPRWFLASAYQHELTSPFARQIVELIQAKAAVRGGCMPSSHFAIALSIQMYCFRYYRKVGWMILPIVFGLAMGTFWGRYHYVSDVVVGGLIGFVITVLVWKFSDKSPSVTIAPLGEEALKQNHVT
jgi:membrane-associated phospholipid phosphatase